MVQECVCIKYPYNKSYSMNIDCDDFNRKQQLRLIKLHAYIVMFSNVLRKLGYIDVGIDDLWVQYRMVT